MMVFSFDVLSPSVRRPLALLVTVALLAACAPLTASDPSRTTRPAAPAASVAAAGPADVAALAGLVGGGAHDHQAGPSDRMAAAVFAAPAPLPRAGWTATASDEETAGEDGRAANVLDGNTGTHWHSKWSAPATPLPHSLTIDTQQSRQIAGLSYLPRPTHPNGRIGGFEIHVSTDGVSWGSPVAAGTWADTSAEKTILFAATTARYVRLRGLTEAGNRGPWSSAAEVNLLAEQTTTPPPPADGPLPRTNWTAVASDQETAGENGRASNVVDGNNATYWHSRWSPAPAAPFPHTLTIDMAATHQASGLRYSPRTNSDNGRIGAFSVSVSTTGTSWSPPVAAGTWADTATEKTVTFPAVTARFVRLTATSEAGGRGPFSAAAEINVLGKAGTTTPLPPSLGSWGPTIGFPLVPAAAALLPGNRLLTWSAYATTTFSGGRGKTQTSILNLSTGAVSRTEVANTGHDMFCPGSSLLADGRILISGGNNSAKTTIYDPAGNTWSAGPDMKIPRAYQSNTTMGNGEVFSIGGSWAGGIGGKHGEVWSAPGGWRTLTNVRVDPFLTADPAGQFRSDNHAWLFTTGANQVFHAGPSRRMNWVSTSGTGSVTSAGLRSDSPDAMNGNAVMYDVGRILTVGGATAYENTNATARAYTINLNNNAAVTRVGDMAYPRAFANGVALPDGQVLVVGGQSRPMPFSDAGSAMAPEIWNPATGRFTTLAPMAVPRNYHSVALLLPDGRVFVGGGGLCGSCGTNHPDGHVFTPPYLLNPDGTMKARPTIVSAPSAATAGGTISVTTAQPVTRFSLMRMSTVTHTVNTDQRRIPLTATSSSGNTATLQIPANRGVVLPGVYMLFAMDANGVPSTATTIKIG